MPLIKNKHLFIPDVQAEPDIPLDHLRALGNYILDQKPDVIVCAGDFADFPSLSKFSKPIEVEGKRLINDIKSARHAMEVLMEPVIKYNERRYRNKKKQYNPRLVMTMGNHEYRVTRYVEDHPLLEGILDHSDPIGYTEFGWELVPFEHIINIDGIRYCLAPHHKVLTRDLKWIELGNLSVGDKLIGFDEYPQGKRFRRYHESEVLYHEIIEAETLKVTLSNGQEFITTLDHGWLVSYIDGGPWRWKTAQNLVPYVDTVPNVFDVWEEENSKEAGWLAGIFDGEGSVSFGNKQNKSGFQVAVAQNEGIVLQRILKGFDERGFRYAVYEDGKCKKIAIRGTQADKVKLIGILRPERLIANFEPEMLGSMQQADNKERLLITKVENLGVQKVVSIETSTKTMIVDGIPHHNCHYFRNPQSLKRGILGGTIDNKLNKLGWSFTMGHQQTLQYGVQHLSDGTVRQGLVAGAFYMHDMDYMGPQGNPHWRGVVVKHEVHDGQYCPMFVSINYLLEKWT